MKGISPPSVCPVALAVNAKKDSYARLSVPVETHRHPWSRERCQDDFWI